MSGGVLRKTRTGKGMTQKELGELVGRSKQTISSIEVGVVDMNLQMTMKVAAALQVDPAIFLPAKTRKNCRTRRMAHENQYNQY